jgi:hypothetical protein
LTYIDQVGTFTSNLNNINHEKNTNCNEFNRNKVPAFGVDSNIYLIPLEN